MVKRHETTLIVLSILFLGLILGQDVADAQEPKAPVKELGQIPEITLEVLSKEPEMYVDKEIVVRGKLKVIGNYYSWDSKFVVEDEKGNMVPVIPWLPITIAQPLKGFGPGDEKQVMSYYLNKNLFIRGRVMAKKGKIRLDIEGEYYLEVGEAKETNKSTKGGGIR